MDKGSDRWNEVNPSRHLHEREALAWLREQLPDGEPFRAWSNVEFVGDDGTINEIDLFVVARVGIYLIELKGYPGMISGDNTKWNWTKPNGKRVSFENPLLMTRRKCHRMESLLQRQPGLRGLKGRAPIRIEPIVFLTDVDLDCQLNPAGRTNVFGRGVAPKRPGAYLLPSIVELLVDTLPLAQQGKRTKHAIDGPLSRAIDASFDQANIRPSTAERRIGDYDLIERIAEGPGWEDWEARHRASMVRRRIRRWLTNEGRTEAEVQRLNRAALREFNLLKVLRHDGVLLPLDLREHDLGPALVFEFDESDRPLDLWLEEHGDSLDLAQRITLVRDLAEAVAHAHRKQVFHRALSPASVRVTDRDGSVRVQVADWQASTRPQGTRTVEAGTLHVADLVSERTHVYLAPEGLLSEDCDARALDVFSLGALAHLVLTGAPPANDYPALRERLGRSGGLDITDVLDGALEALRELVLEATSADVSKRMGTADDFLAWLDLAQETMAEAHREVTAGHEVEVLDPLQAEVGALLQGGWRLERRLGKGSTAVALLVERDGREEVWKVALDPSKDEHLRDEFDALQRVRHNRIVQAYQVSNVGPRTVLHLERAGERTLAQHIRDQGRVGISFLERWGVDLLEVMASLEAAGVAHRDIKPDNIGVKPAGKNEALHLMLFDFSLARASAMDVHVGTAAYLDPFLPVRPNGRWDWQADRWSAAITLYEMAAGHRPKWQGGSDPTLVPEISMHIEGELFDPSISAGLAAFFTKAFRRDPHDRFDTIEEMSAAWKKVFAQAMPSDDRPVLEIDVQHVLRSTPLVALGLSASALEALGRRNLHTAGDLVDEHLGALSRMANVDDRTRREVADVHRQLRDRFEPTAGEDDTPAFALDRLHALIPRKDGRQEDAHVIRLLTDPEAPAQLTVTGDAQVLPRWPDLGQVAAAAGMTRADVEVVLESATNRWKKVKPFSDLWHDLDEMLEKNGGVASADELAQYALSIRGAASSRRDQIARAVVRAIVEYDQALSEPHWEVARHAGQLLVASSVCAADGGVAITDYASQLGGKADHLVAGGELVAPDVVLAALKAVPEPAGFDPLPDARLVKLAAASSASAAATNRLELYPRGLAARRAVQLARATLLGAGTLSLDAVRDRVRARFPEAEVLPDRPVLDTLMSEVGLHWIGQPGDAASGYRVKPIEVPVSSTSHITVMSPVALDAERERAAEMDARLARLVAGGGFCVLNVRPSRAELLELRLQQRTGGVVVDVDQLLLDRMRAVAAEFGVSWDLVAATDANPTSADWRKVKALAMQALPAVREAILAASDVVIITNLGLADRFFSGATFQELLGALRDHGDGVAPVPGARAKGVLVVVPTTSTEARPMVGASPVPVHQPSQWAAVPTHWLDDRPLTTAGDH